MLPVRCQPLCCGTSGIATASYVVHSLCSHGVILPAIVLCWLGIIRVCVISWSFKGPVRIKDVLPPPMPYHYTLFKGLRCCTSVPNQKAFFLPVSCAVHLICVLRPWPGSFPDHSPHLLPALLPVIWVSINCPALTTALCFNKLCLSWPLPNRLLLLSTPMVPLSFCYWRILWG